MARAKSKDCRFTQPFGGILAVAFSRDGTVLAFGDTNGTVHVWHTSLTDGKPFDLEQPLLTLHGHTRWILSLSWHPDGKRLMSRSDDRTIKLWDVQISKCVPSLAGHTSLVWAIAWSPDGN